MKTPHVGFFPPIQNERLPGVPAQVSNKRYFISFVHKLLPHGTKEFANVIINLEPGEVFDVRYSEDLIQKQSNVQDVTILYFQLLTNGEK